MKPALSETSPLFAASSSAAGRGEKTLLTSASSNNGEQALLGARSSAPAAPRRCDASCSACSAVCTRGVRGGCAGFFGPRAALQGVSLVLFGEPGERPWFNVLLVLVPIALASYGVPALGSPPVAFVVSLLAMLPLAERLGFCTEQLSEHVTDTLAGLLNASMGNAPELVIALFALRDGLLRVVQLSLIGSVLSNLLLVLGMSLLVGGARHAFQPFKSATSGLNAGMLVAASMAVLLPTALVATSSEQSEGTSSLLASRVGSLFLLALYLVYLLFQLKTHAQLYDDDEEEEAGVEEDEEVAIGIAAGDEDGGCGHAAAAGSGPAGRHQQPARKASSASGIADQLSVTSRERKGSTASSVRTSRLLAQRARKASTASSSRTDQATGRRMSVYKHAPVPAVAAAAVEGAGGVTPAVEVAAEGGGLSFPASLLWLGFIGVLVAVVSAVLVGSLEGASESWGLGEAFISCILLPVAGNAAEHYSAVVFARRNRLDLSLGIAVGSSLQIYLFVLPLLVVIAWCAGIPLSLDLQPFEGTTLILAVLVSVFLLLNGRSTYMSGATLLASYAIVAVGYSGRSSPAR